MSLKKYFKPKSSSLRILHTEPNVEEDITKQIISWLPKFPKEYVIICIGTDRSTGDALGPLTGSILAEKRLKHMHVYGTLHEPVHAKNLKDYIHIIQNKHPNAFIIAVDACLGKSSSVGCIVANQEALRPGAALNKVLPEIGDIHLTGVVNINGFMEFAVLQNTRLSIVKDMANILATILITLDSQLTYEYTSPVVVLPHFSKETIE